MHQSVSRSSVRPEITRAENTISSATTGTFCQANIKASLNCHLRRKHNQFKSTQLSSSNTTETPQSSSTRTIRFRVLNYALLKLQLQKWTMKTHNPFDAPASLPTSPPSAQEQNNIFRYLPAAGFSLPADPCHELMKQSPAP